MKKTNDELLADFVGKRIAPPSDGYDQQWEFPFCEGYYPTLKTMKFKTSWDWLMPVVEKINSLLDDGSMEGQGFDIDILRSMQDWIISVNIKNACADAVTIIQWYNDNKKV